MDIDDRHMGKSAYPNFLQFYFYASSQINNRKISVFSVIAKNTGEFDTWRLRFEVRQPISVTRQPISVTRQPISVTHRPISVTRRPISVTRRPISVTRRPI